MNKSDNLDANVEKARAKAMRDAEIAFVNVDSDGNGTISFSEAERLIKDSSYIDEPDESIKTKIEAFFSSFDKNRDNLVSKQEWLDFYGTLFDNIIIDGLKLSHAINEWKGRTY